MTDRDLELMYARIQDQLISLEEALTRVPVAAGLATVATLFDFVCEYHGMPKEKALDMLNQAIPNVNKELGPMMGCTNETKVAGLRMEGSE